jgi:uncharacterized damage-inducible protein DinB
MTPFLQAAVAEMLPNAGTSPACAECGFSWSMTGEQALSEVLAGPERFARLLDQPEAAIAPAGNAWSASAYVWHVGDVVRAWAERLHTLGTDPNAPWAPFDPDELSRARHYDELPVATASWALARSVEALVQSLEALTVDTPFDHPEWGHGTVADALRWLAHETVHHDLDIRRGLGQQ